MVVVVGGAGFLLQPLEVVDTIHEVLLCRVSRGKEVVPGARCLLPFCNSSFTAHPAAHHALQRPPMCAHTTDPLPPPLPWAPGKPANTLFTGSQRVAEKLAKDLHGKVGALVFGLISSVWQGGDGVGG